jgi:hypothetical protein
MKNEMVALIEYEKTGMMIEDTTFPEAQGELTAVETTYALIDRGQVYPTTIVAQKDATGRLFAKLEDLQY